MRYHSRKRSVAPKSIGQAVALLSVSALLFSMIQGVILFHTDNTSNDEYDEYELARKESFGFFDNYPQADWKRAQEIHAKVFPNHYSNDMTQYSSVVDKTEYSRAERLKKPYLIAKGQIYDVRDSNWWNAENFQVEFHCPLAQRIPADSSGDGPKWVCDPHRLRNDSNDNKKSCLVYSFGSNGKTEFEKGIKDEIGDHCEIHTFDGVTYNKRNGNFAEKLQGIAEFHPWFLGTEEEGKQQKKGHKTLAQTMEELGHSGRTIDIFKIDCEWCEWFTFDTWLEQDIRQILVETHNAPMPQARNFFHQLHDAGFVIFSKEANYQNGGGGVEFAFLKLTTDFFINGSMYNATKQL
eukprot:CAMPEP_0198255438 /NCGR_PEP_ID=MMETSP1447-20131203/5558_1 /TAXON_ID=420782 /ORGANISM="Chaetoceros dichaeta, Strain CCMP1751" /LENGTH=350 /DNA_ID=CAMNT_0043941805 /DNA_START=35 /DNA_END=1087 /DNA_ORIENTATION=+